MKTGKRHGWVRPVTLLATVGLVVGLMASHSVLAQGRGRGGTNGCLRKCANEGEHTYRACMRDLGDDGICMEEGYQAQYQCQVENGCAWSFPFEG